MAVREYAMTCVLVCEDDPSIAEFLALVITKAGGKAFIENDPFNALSMWLQDRRITAALIDYNLQCAMTGIEVLSAFQEVRPEVRRILITANARDADITEALASAVAEVLLDKPPRLADLRAALGLTSGGRGSSSRP